MNKNLKLLCSAALSLSLLAVPASAADFTVSAAAGEAVWSLDKAYGSLRLVVSGPDGFHYDRTFGEGERPSVDLFAGNAGDGGYTWSLTAISKVDDALRQEMQAARDAGDQAFFDRLKAEGRFESVTRTGHFTLAGGQLVTPGATEIREGGDSDVANSAKALPTKAQVFTTDLIVQGSECVGTDCTSSENFGFDTLRLKENNLRIKFQDTSSSGSFPSTDWELTANDSNNGGANRFSITNVTNNTTPFTVAGDAGNNTLYLAKDRKVGINTANPAVNLHIVEGNTPTLRLEQDGSAGFQSQTWDLAGNETNFFVRDVNNSSKLPFKVFPNSATNQLTVGNNGVGVGIQTASADLHVKSTDGAGQILIQETNGTDAQRIVMKLENNGFTSFQMEDTSSGNKWSHSVKDAGFEISKGGTGTEEFVLDASGNLTITGTLTVGSGMAYPDYVFRDGYDLLTLDQVEAFIEANGHLPNVKSEEDVEFGKRINMTELSISLLEKVEELTLYTIDQHKTLGAQESTIERQNELIRQLEERLTALESKID